MKVEKVINEAELRSIIRRRLLKDEITFLKESSTGMTSTLVALSGISPPHGTTSQVMSQAEINLLASASSILADLINNPLLATTSIGTLVTLSTGNPFLGVLSAYGVASQLSSLKAYVDTKLNASVLNSQQQTSANNSYALRQPGYYDLGKQIENDILSQKLNIPGIKVDSNQHYSFVSDASNQVIEGFLGIPFSDFKMDFGEDTGSSGEIIASNLISFFMNSPSSSLSDQDQVNAITSTLKLDLGESSLALIEYDTINRFIYDLRNNFTPFEGEQSLGDPVKYGSLRADFETGCNYNSPANDSAAYYLSSVMKNRDSWSANDFLFPNPNDFDTNTELNDLVGIIKSKTDRKAFKIKNDLTNYQLAKDSALIYDPDQKYHVEEGDYLFFGHDFFKEAALGVFSQNVTDMGNKILSMSKSVGLLILDNYPDALKDSDGDIQTALDDLKAVLDDENSGPIECLFQVLKTLLTILVNGGEAAFTGLSNLLQGIFGDPESDDELDGILSGGNQGSGTRASTSGVSTGSVKDNVITIQTLMNQYKEKHNLDNPKLALDGNWRNRDVHMNYMWFDILEHADLNNSWYKTTKTHEVDNQGWPVTAQRLRDLDNESFTGDTVGCIAFLEKLLESTGEVDQETSLDGPGSERLEAPVTNTISSGGSGTQPLGFPRGADLRVTNVNGATYLEDLGFSDGSTGSLMTQILTARDRNYTGSGEYLNFKIKLNDRDKSVIVRRVGKSKGEKRRDRKGVEGLLKIIKDFFKVRRNRPNFSNELLRTTEERSNIYKFEIGVKVPSGS